MSSSRSKRDRSNDRDNEKRKKHKDETKRRKGHKEIDSSADRKPDLGAYSELDNPFNDINLGQQFKWQKKIERERKRGVSPTSSRRHESQRREAAKEELELLNRRRTEREQDQLLREEEESRMSRLAETAQMSEWLSKEGEFQLEQERTRSVIRLKEKRAKAVDFLALNLKYTNQHSDDDPSWSAVDDDGLEIDLDEPYAIFETLSLEQTEELHHDIQRYLTLEKSSLNLEFWTNMMVVCEDQLDRQRLSHRLGRDAAARKADVTAAVNSEVDALLCGKSYDELSLLQRQVQSKLLSKEPVDTDYWESLLKSLFVWKAKSKLKAIHEVVVRNRLEQLRRHQRDQALNAQQELLADVPTRSLSENSAPSNAANSEQTRLMYIAGMSPVLQSLSIISSSDLLSEVITQEADLRILYEQRRQVADARLVPKRVPTTGRVVDHEAASTVEVSAEALWKAEAEKNLEEEEELFNIEAAISTPTTYSWEDKYRPRKPRYFNRVHTGYEWNKYNQTHYDTDNPPPKVVQGYKFNVFYPDLIDKSRAPSFKIIREAGLTETVLLRFSAGPPYEDIAFRIVDREWEYSHKRGFRSSFDRGCLSLWFNFQRNFYRK